MNAISLPKIDSYRFGRIVIDGQTYTKDIIILPNRLIPNWWRAEGHKLHLSDLQEVLKDKPSLLIIGKGAFGRLRIEEDTILGLDKAGIKLIAMNSKEACQHYNEIREHGDIALALHLSC